MSSLPPTEPTRGPKFAGAADNGWKPAGTAVKGGGRAGTMRVESVNVGQPWLSIIRNRESVRINGEIWAEEATK